MRLDLVTTKHVLRRHWQMLSLILLLLVGINILFYLVSPREIVEYIGVENSYLIVFLIAAFGGLNTFTSGVLYASIVTFAAGGSAPWLIGIMGGLGIALGDSIVFNLVKYGSKSIDESLQQRIAAKRAYIDRYPRSLQYFVIYLYLAITPLPNDLMMVATALLGYSFKKLVPLIILGGVTIGLIMAYLGDIFGEFLVW